MSRKPRKDGRRGPDRSADQREWNVAVGMASKLWNILSEPQRLAWNARAKTLRSTGQKYCNAVNAPRFRDRLEPLREPPAPPTYSGKKILKRSGSPARGPGQGGNKRLIPMDILWTPYGRPMEPHRSNTGAMPGQVIWRTILQSMWELRGFMSGFYSRPTLLPPPAIGIT
jgi:hypothetical protein